MTNFLVVITFLTGATWGPVVTMTSTAGPRECAALMHKVAEQIAKSSRTNVTSVVTVNEDGSAVTVNGGVAAKREIARMGCETG